MLNLKLSDFLTLKNNVVFEVSCAPYADMQYNSILKCADYLCLLTRKIPSDLNAKGIFIVTLKLYVLTDSKLKINIDINIKI